MICLNKWVLCMDIGGTNIRVGMVDEGYDLDSFIITNSVSILNGKESVKNLIELIKRYIKKYAADRYPIAISMGFPATLDKNKKIILSAPNVKGIDNTSIVDILQKEFEVPTFINKDVNMLVHFDIFKLNLKSDGIIIGCYIGTGFGNSICINGSIYEGYSGSAGELGHIPMLGKNDICGCGNRGCIENYTGGKQLEYLRNTYFSGTDISKIFEVHGNEPQIEEYIEALSIPIATEINILDPEYVIIGGGVVHMKGFPFEKFEQHIMEHTRKPYPQKTIKLKYSIQQQENGVIGAGIYAFNELRKMPTGFLASTRS